jgi:hypothetical protein
MLWLRNGILILPALSELFGPYIAAPMAVFLRTFLRYYCFNEEFFVL